MLTLGVILLIWCVAAAALWIAVWLRIAHTMRQRPSVRAGLELPQPDGGWPRLSIIVPAHNEDRVIAECAQSLLDQTYPDLEIIFVLDRCTDSTRHRLQLCEDDPRVTIVENESCPPEWAGKCNAAHVGTDHATGAYLLFTDADTVFHPHLCRAAVALARQKNLALLSLLSDLTYRSVYECIAQPVAGMNLLRIYPLTRGRSGKQVRPFANGQFMLFDRLRYDGIGRHAAVKDDLLEDLAFARLLQRSGGATSVVLAEGMLSCSMYDSMAAFRRGWKRIFIEACRRKHRRLVKHSRRILLIGVATPLAQIAALIVAALLDIRLLSAALVAAVLGGVFVQAASLLRVYRLSGAPLLAVLTYPLGCWVVAMIMLEGALDLRLRRPVIWGGKQYVLEPK